MSKKGGPGDDDDPKAKAAAKGDCFEHDDEEQQRQRTPLAEQEEDAQEDHDAGTADGNNRDDGNSNSSGGNGNGRQNGNGASGNARHPQRGGDTRHPLGASDESLAGWLSAESSTIDLSAAGRTIASGGSRSLAAASGFGASAVSAAAGGSSSSSSRQPSRPGAYAMRPTPLATALRRSSNEFRGGGRGDAADAASGRRRRQGQGQGAGGNDDDNDNNDDDDDDDNDNNNDDDSSVHYAVGMTVPVAPPEESDGNNGAARSVGVGHRGSESLLSTSTYAIAEPMSIGSSMQGEQEGDSIVDDADGNGSKASVSASSPPLKRCVPLILILALVGIVVGVTVPLVSSRSAGTDTTAGGTSMDAPTTTPGAGTEAMETGEFEAYVQSILDFFYQPARAGNSTAGENDNAFGDPTSPQSLALDWVVSHDSYSRSAYRQHYMYVDGVDGRVSDERDCPEEELGQIIIQRYVLAVVYYSTDGANWDDSLGFLSADTPECSWNVYDNATETLVGVADCTVDLNAGTAVSTDPCTQGTDHVYRPIASLVLARNGLLGTIPSELGLLSGLKVLDFSSNGLESTIPSQLGLISSTLEKMDLGENGLIGSIPPEIFVEASTLQELELWGNDFTGKLPATLGDCTSLKNLGFAWNQISGPIPTEIGKLANLENLVFWRNKVSGSIPTEMGNCQSLHTYSSPFNQMTGPFPTELGRLANLTTVFAYENMHSGQIPSELGNLRKLEVFNVAINNLSGTLPTEIGQISSLRRFRYFENMGISGTVPSAITSLPLLEDVWMEKTQLGGPFPSVFHPESRIGSISAENSAFTGTVPTEIWSMPNLVDVKIINTTMAGSPIPDVLPEGNNADQILDLLFSGNAFSGTLPPIIGSFQSLAKLLLQDNAFSGDVPSELSSLESLVELQIQGNDFDSVPPSMCNLRNASEGGMLETYVSDCEKVGCTCCTDCLHNT